MLKWLSDLLSKPQEDVRIEVDGATLVFNHRLKIAILYCADPATTDDTYAGLDAHLEKRGYFLQIIIGSPAMRQPILGQE